MCFCVFTRFYQLFTRCRDLSGFQFLCFKAFALHVCCCNTVHSLIILLLMIMIQGNNILSLHAIVYLDSHKATLTLPVINDCTSFQIFRCILIISHTDHRPHPNLTAKFRPKQYHGPWYGLHFKACISSRLARQYEVEFKSWTSWTCMGKRCGVVLLQPLLMILCLFWWGAAPISKWCQDESLLPVC